MSYRILAIIFSLLSFLNMTHAANEESNPHIAIISYGPHSSLNDLVEGIKDGLKERGYDEGSNLKITLSDVNFDAALIAQMVAKAKASKPDVIIAMTTPVAQMAKNMIKDIPVIFTAITDPVEAKLLTQADKSEGNLTGSSDQQSAEYVLSMAKKIMPSSDVFGVLYSTAEANDTALLNMMTKEAEIQDLTLLAVPIDQMRDIPMRMKQFNKLADFIYVGTSGPIQPALPAITATASKMGIPVINADPDAVKHHQALASFGVRYYRIGVQTSGMVARVINGEDIANITPLVPSQDEHHAYISQKQVEKYNITLPADTSNITIIK